MRGAAASLAVVFLALAGVPDTLGQQVQEYDLKAAFIYNFGLLTDWPRSAPAGADGSFRLCVIGRNPFDKSLAKLEGKPVHGRRIVLREIASPRAAQDCHILFIALSEAGPLNAIIESLGDSSVLTVAESADGRATAAAITLLSLEQRVTFAINLGAARRASLHISPRLLRLAVKVIEE